MNDILIYIFHQGFLIYDGPGDQCSQFQGLISSTFQVNLQAQSSLATGCIAVKYTQIEIPVFRNKRNLTINSTTFGFAYMMLAPIISSSVSSLRIIQLQWQGWTGSTCEFGGLSLHLSGHVELGTYCKGPPFGDGF